MSILWDCLQKLNKAKHYANMDLDFERKENPVKYQKILDSREGVRDIENEYYKAVIQSSVFVFVNGSQKKNFLNKISTEYGGFVSQVDSFFDLLLSNVDESFYDGSIFNKTKFGYIADNISDICIDLNIVAFTQPLYKERYSTKINSKDDLKNICKDVIISQVGSEILGIYAAFNTYKECLEQSFDGEIVPIFLDISDSFIYNSLLKNSGKISDNIFSITAGNEKDGFVAGKIKIEKITKEEMENILNDIKNKVKKG